MPDDYTPTTEDIRVAWTHGFHGNNHNDQRVEYTGKEFDRWESQHALNLELTRFSNRHLRKLADEAERIIQERNDDGVMG